MRLDFLHNYPLNQKANAFFLSKKYPNASMFDSKDEAKREICKQFDAEVALPLGFDAWGFLGFFTFLKKFGKIAYGIGNHQQMHYGFDMLNAFALSLNKQDGLFDFMALKEAINQQCRVFVIPFINQDIFSQNDLEAIFDFLSKRLKNFLLVIDISLALSLNLKPRLNDERVLFLLNGENIGLLRGSGLILAKKDFGFPFVLGQNGVFEAFLQAFAQRKSIAPFCKKDFFVALKTHLDKDVDLFVPLEFGAVNTLALRFYGIKARLLLQDLFIKGIFGANGQECLFGLSQPSFVLQKMGYSQEESRELLAFSIQKLEKKEMLIASLCESYKQIKTLKL